MPPALRAAALCTALCAVVLLTFGAARLVQREAPRWYASVFGAGDDSTAHRTVDASDGDVLLLLRGEQRVLLRKGARVQVEESRTHSECELLSGSVLVHVPEGTRRRFTVRTASTLVEVTGTVFGVREHAGTSSVTVWDGSVDVKRGAERALLSAGQHWPVSEPALGVSRGELERLGAHTRLAPLEEVRDVAPAPTAAPEPSARATPAATAANSESREPTPAEGALAARYRAAQALEADGTPARAAALYAELAEQPGSFAEASAFALARLRYSLRQYTAARRALGAYRARYPGGSFARAVDVLMLRVAIAERDDVTLEREAERFLASFPRDPRAAQFRWARAESWARRGRCREALRERPLLNDAQAEILAALCSPDVLRESR